MCVQMVGTLTYMGFTGTLEVHGHGLAAIGRVDWTGVCVPTLALCSELVSTHVGGLRLLVQVGYLLFFWRTRCARWAHGCVLCNSSLVGGVVAA